MWRSIYHELRRWAKVSRRVAVAYKRTEITVETDELWIIQKSRVTRGWCAECGKEVDMVGLTEAEILSGLTQPGLTQSGVTQQSLTRPGTTQPGMSQQTMSRSALNEPPENPLMLPGCRERPGWHRSRAADGSPLVCLESLLK
jgi:hypothetical protein